MLQRALAGFVLAVLAISILAPSSDAATIGWANPTSGAWSDSTNWSPMQVPGPGDTALISVVGSYTVTLDVDASVDQVTVGTGTGSQTLAISGQTLTVASGTSTVGDGATLTLGGGGLIDGTGSLFNDGFVDITAGTVAVDFDNDGSMDSDGASSILGAFTTGDFSVVRVQSGTLTVDQGFTNNNQLQLLGPGAGLTITAGALTNAAGSIVLCSGVTPARVIQAEVINDGTFTVATNLQLNRADSAHENNGTINCFVGSLFVLQSGTSPSFTNTGTLYVATSRIISIDAGVVDNVGTGLIRGGGTFDVSGATFTNAGVVTPGASPGILTNLGDYTQDAAGELRVEIGGLTVGTGYDRLAVSGAAAIDGTLDISLVNGFHPLPGDSFEILTASAVSGDFAALNGLDLGGGVFFTPVVEADRYILLTEADPDQIAPVDPGICITEANPCVTVDFDYIRIDTSPVRGYSVTFSIQGGLELCDGLNSINEGPFLSDFCGGGCTAIQKVDNGGGSYTFDATILGANCGPTTGGTLFTVDVTDAAGDGSGSLVVTAVTARDCDNQPVVAAPGPGVTIGIDVTTPPALGLTAAQITSGNDTDGTTLIQVDLTGIESGNTIEVFRKGFGGYPEYTGSVPTIPANAADALAEGWTLTGLSTASGTDEPPLRDYYYYVGFQTSDCGVFAGPSNLAGGALNYHLGDTSDGITQGQGDNAVGTADLSLLGANYLTNDVGSVPYLDFGPTVDFSVSSRPVPDGAINFEELILVGINFNEVGVNGPSDPVAEIGANERPGLYLVVNPIRRASSSPALVGADAVNALDATNTAVGEFTARLELKGNGSIVKGIHSEIQFDSERLELLGVEEGTLLGDQTGLVFSKHLQTENGLVFDSAVIGQGRTYEGSGDVAVLRFRVIAPGAKPMLASADLRDRTNRKLLETRNPAPELAEPQSRELDSDRGASTPRLTELLGARPNPFASRTDIVFRLAEAQPVSIVVHDVNGREVRNLRNETMGAGEHSVAWDGRNDFGRTLPAGVYWYTLRAGNLNETQKLFIAR